MCDKKFNIAENPKYYGYQRGLASMVFKFFDKKAFGSDVLKMRIFYTKSYINQLLEVKKRKVHSTFTDNISVADLTDMQLISKFNKIFFICFLLCVVDIVSKYTLFLYVVTISNAFKKFLTSLIANQTKHA